MFPEKLVCPRCGNTSHFRETALRYTTQAFTVPQGGDYGEADWDCFEVVGDESFPVEILCDAEGCRAGRPIEPVVIWRHPHLEAVEQLLVEDTPAESERG